MPKEHERVFSLKLWDKSKKFFVWYGFDYKKEERIDEPLILEIVGEKLYFYSDEFKIAYRKKIDHDFEWTYDLLALSHQKQVYEKFYELQNEENLFQKTLYLKLKSKYLSKIFQSQEIDIKKWIQKAVFLDKSLKQIVKEKKLKNNQVESYFLEINKLKFEIQKFKQLVNLLDEQINTLFKDRIIFLEKNLDEYNEQQRLEYELLEKKIQELNEKFLVLENDYEKMDDNVVNLITVLEKSDTLMMEVYKLDQLRSKKSTQPEIIVKDSEILVMEKELKSKSEEVLDANSMIVAKNVKILSMEKELRLKLKELLDANSMIAAQDVKILSMKKELRSKRKQILDANSMIATKDVEILRLQEHEPVVVSDDMFSNQFNLPLALAEANNTIAGKNAEILRLQEELKSKSKEVLDANNRIIAQDLEISRLQEQEKERVDELLFATNDMNSDLLDAFGDVFSNRSGLDLSLEEVNNTIAGKNAEILNNNIRKLSDLTNDLEQGSSSKKLKVDNSLVSFEEFDLDDILL